MRKYLLVIGLGLMLVGLVIGVSACQPKPTPVVVEAEAVRERASIYAREDSYIVNGADILWYSDDRTTQTASVAGDSGDITGATLDISGLFQPSFADLTATDGLTITPAYTVYALDSAGAVTVTLAASGDEGQLLILIGDDNNNVTVADTNLRSADGGVIVIAQYEVVMFVYQDSEWLVVANTDNS